MESNIDLTLNRDFRKKVYFNPLKRIRLERIIENINKSDFSWGFNEKFRFKKEILLTGNKEERTQKREMITFGEGNICDCCGKPLAQLPWRNTRLCTDCEESLEISVNRGRLPWN